MQNSKLPVVSCLPLLVFPGINPNLDARDKLRYSKPHERHSDEQFLKARELFVMNDLIVVRYVELHSELELIRHLLMSWKHDDIFVERSKLFPSWSGVQQNYLQAIRDWQDIRNVQRTLIHDRSYLKTAIARYKLQLIGRNIMTIVETQKKRLRTDSWADVSTRLKISTFGLIKSRIDQEVRNEIAKIRRQEEIWQNHTNPTLWYTESFAMVWHHWAYSHQRVYEELSRLAQARSWENDTKSLKLKWKTYNKIRLATLALTETQESFHGDILQDSMYGEIASLVTWRRERASKFPDSVSTQDIAHG